MNAVYYSETFLLGEIERLKNTIAEMAKEIADLRALANGLANQVGRNQ